MVKSLELALAHSDYCCPKALVMTNISTGRWLIVLGSAYYCILLNQHHKHGSEDDISQVHVVDSRLPLAMYFNDQASSLSDPCIHRKAWRTTIDEDGCG
jgi:hypothetical protein